MVRLAERSGISRREFLEWEADQETRYEYFQGEVFAMAGGSPRHNALSSRVSAALLGAMDARGCTVLSSDQRIGVDGGLRYVYADVSVVCGRIVLEEGTRDVITNPAVVVEVLSESTEQYDRGLKWEGYQRLASLTDYLLVSQKQTRVEHFRRDDRGGWLYRTVGPGGRVLLADGTSLEVDAVFAGAVDLPGD